MRRAATRAWWTLSASSRVRIASSCAMRAAVAAARLLRITSAIVALISASKGSSIIEPTFSGRWKLESYDGATAPVVGRPHPSAVALDDLFHDRETEARAGFGARLRGPVEAIK